MRSKHLIGTVVLGVALGLASSTQAGTYTFTPIADSTGAYADFRQGPAINDSGQVVFVSTFDASSHLEIVIGDGATKTTLASTASGAGFVNFYGDPSVNNVGEVAFYGYASSLSLGVGIYATDGTTVTPIAYIAGDFGGLGTYDPPGINDSGLVAFHGKPKSSSGLGPEGIFAGSGGPVSILANKNDGFSAFAGKTPFNNAGAALFRAAYDPLGTGGGLFVSDGTGIVTIADTLGAFAGFGDGSLNDAGLAAFMADLDSGDRGVFTSDGTTQTTIVTRDTSPYGTILNEVAINNAGDVAFVATLDAGGSGLFTGPDPVADRVIGTGDVLGSSSVAEVHIHVESINSDGQIAFWARLDDGTKGIYRAEPEPEEVLVTIDIKPGSDPNCINNDGNGVIPVAILGSADFDVTTVDVASVALAGMSVRVAGKSDKYQAHIDDVNGDGFDDLVCQIEDFDGVLDEGADTAVLTGNLLDGTPIVGTDTICIVPPA
jgi:hypothetical protein